jgi:hypothetical protein
VSFAVVPDVKKEHVGFFDFVSATAAKHPPFMDAAETILQTGVKPIAVTSDPLKASSSVPLHIVLDESITRYQQNPSAFGWDQSPQCPVIRGGRMADLLSATIEALQQQGKLSEHPFQLAALPHLPGKAGELRIGLEYKIRAEIFDEELRRCQSIGQHTMAMQKALQTAAPRLLNVAQFCFLHDHGELFLIGSMQQAEDGAWRATPSFQKAGCTPEVLMRTAMRSVLEQQQVFDPLEFTSRLSQTLLHQSSLLKPCTIDGITMMLGDDDRGGYKLAQFVEIESREALMTLQQEGACAEVLGLFKVQQGSLSTMMPQECIVRTRYADHELISLGDVEASNTLTAFMTCLTAALTLDANLLA